ncbi:MAG: BMP family ABC transporter substrate-binding protein [Synergistaceae bacterium]|nr:BMP family ABC transporter substrate-binding protein [Synergistaceae bacterium]
MKKFLCALLACLLVVSFAGLACAKKLNIAFVTFGDVESDPFYRENYSGIQAFINTHPGARVKVFKGAKLNAPNVKRVFAKAVKASDVVIYSDGILPEVAEIVKANPRVKFILTQEWLTDKNGKNFELPNVKALCFREDESGFLAGLAAALTSKTKKVASVHGVAIPSNIRFKNGFIAGVHYANEKYNTNVNIVELPEYGAIDTTGNFVGSFKNAAKGRIIGKALIDSGCDVIFASAGESGNGVIDSAKDSGNVKIIGCDTDQFDLGFDGDKNIILTSVIKLIAPQILGALNDIDSNYFSSGNYLLGASSHAIGYVKGEHCLLDSDVREKLDSALDMMKSGELIPLK